MQRRPPRVKPAERFENNLKVLKVFFEGNSPVELTVRLFLVAEVIYQMGDASGRGFGNAFNTTDRLLIQIGKWTYKKRKKLC